jgi:glycosyltransferase involved in cell wall biosynthesis
VKKNRVVFVGRLVPHKNVIDALQAVLLAKKAVPDLELAIISPGGLDEKTVVAFAAKYPFIRYHKAVSDQEKTSILATSKLLVHPGSREGFGLVLIEGLVCGVPFLAYDVQIMREMVTLTNGGLTVPNRDTVKLSEKIVEIMQNEDLRLKLASEGGCRVTENFTWMGVAKKYESTINSLL